jgi:uncharacterized protein with HEPN domain
MNDETPKWLFDLDPHIVWGVIEDDLALLLEDLGRLLETG